MTEIELIPFIQTHTFSVEPYLTETQGYAPFIASSDFTGHEKVTFQSKNGSRLPDIETSERQLNEFKNGKWYLSDIDRTRSALGGALRAGTYTFLIEGLKKNILVVDVAYNQHFVQPVSNLIGKDSANSVEVSWDKPPNADSFWVFVIPTDAKNFLNELVPITENKYSKESFELRKDKLPSGVYRFAIRANQMWKHPNLSGFISESWATSSATFRI